MSQSDVSPKQAASTPPEELHDLKSLVRWQLGRKSGGFEMRNPLERMDAAAIRDLLVELLAAQKEADAPDLREILAAASNELFRREGEKSLDWANGLDPAIGRQSILDGMIVAAATEAPEMAKPWIDRYDAEFGRDIFNEFSRAAITGATARGAEDLLRLKKLYGDYLGSSQFPIGPYPDGFDFRLLVTSLPFHTNLRPTLACWIGRRLGRESRN